jgi:hypothetical protein
MVQNGLFWNAVPGYFWLELHIDRMTIKQTTPSTPKDMLRKFNNKVENRKSKVL